MFSISLEEISTPPVRVIESDFTPGTSDGATLIAGSIVEDVPKSPTFPRHSQYYIDEQMAIFLVDEQLFKIHRQFLRNESDVFETMFNCPSPAEGPEGQVDEKPIVLPEVTQNEFVALMDYFYRGTFFVKTATRSRENTLQQDIDLLSIATRYECVEARAGAIRGIESKLCDTVEKLVLAEKYDVQPWLMPGYIELCRRDKPLTPREGQRIGFEKAMMIAAARENLRCSLESKELIANHVRDKCTAAAPSTIPGPPPTPPAVTTWPSSLLEESRAKKFLTESFAPTPQVSSYDHPKQRLKKRKSASPVVALQVSSESIQ